MKAKFGCMDSSDPRHFAMLKCLFRALCVEMSLVTMKCLLLISTDAEMSWNTGPKCLGAQELNFYAKRNETFSYQVMYLHHVRGRN